MLYKLYNGPFPTTAAQAVVTTGTAIKTLMQLKPFNLIKIIEWGLSFDGSTAATPIKCELIETGTVFGTVTAYVDADIHKYEGLDQAVASIAGLTLGTAASGYTCTSEGSIAASRVFDVQLVAPTNQYAWQFAQGREPRCIIGNCTRIRVTAPAAVNAYSWMLIDM